MPILVFKTNLRSRKRIKEVAPHIENIRGIIKWNVDLHDSDKVLRVECGDTTADAITRPLQKAGYYCEELQG